MKSLSLLAGRTVPINVIECYNVTGEWRSNVVPSLTTLHIVFMREHNRIAKRLGEIHPNWLDEQLFQEAKKIVTAEMQHIVYQ